MKTYAITVLMCLGLLRFAGAARGQAPAATPEAQLTAAVAAAQQRYTNSFVGHPLLFNGPEYVNYALRYYMRNGHQFYSAPDMQPGSVYYNDHYFPNVRLAYDVVLDQVVLTQPTSPLQLRLISEKVGYFFVNDHRFIRLVADSTSGSALRTGFYEVLADDGGVQVLAKRSKRLLEQIGQGKVNVEFTPADKLFIKKADTYYPITKESAALRVFSDRGKEVQTYIKEQGLSFSKAQLETSLVQLAQYYGTLPR